MLDRHYLHPANQSATPQATMKNHDWRETTLEGETQMFRASVHAGRWTFFTKMKGDESWAREDPVALSQLVGIRDILWNKYQRGRIAWKFVEQLDKMVEAAGGKSVRPADEKG